MTAVWILVIVGIFIFFLWMFNKSCSAPAANPDMTGGNAQGNDLLYTSYFTPWYQSFTGPYYGTEYQALYNWPYSDWAREPYSYYDYFSYWRRPLYYNYWRRPYYYRRPVYRPYVQDDLLGSRMKQEVLNFRPLREEDQTD